MVDMNLVLMCVIFFCVNCIYRSAPLPTETGFLYNGQQYWDVVQGKPGR
jgi:hypothetical protein